MPSLTPSQLAAYKSLIESGSLNPLDSEKLSQYKSSLPTPEIGSTTNAQRLSLGQRAATGAMKIATSPLARLSSGVAMMLYPSGLGNGTLNTPEAQRLMVENEQARQRQLNPPMPTHVAGFQGDVPLIEGPKGEVFNTKESVQQSMNSAKASPGVAAPATSPRGAAQTEGALSYLGNNAAKQDLRARSDTAETVGPLISSGFRSLNNPQINAPLNGGSPGFDENFLVRERLGTPQAYTAAVQANQGATQRGRQMGLPQDPNTHPYTPNDATQSGMERGGAITEYVIPGKGTATFLGQRQGGGTFSVVGGRTPEEQAAINERVQSINAQTAAMRDLRNTHRQSQGLMTVEQEDQAASLRQMMERMAPQPNTGSLDAQQAEAMKQLKDAQGIRGIGQTKRRQDAMDAAKISLAQLANQRGGLEQLYGNQLQSAQQLMANQSANERAAASGQMEQAKFLASHGIDQSKLSIEQGKAINDALNQAYGLRQGDQRLAIEKDKARRDANRTDPKLITSVLYQTVGDPKDPTGNNKKLVFNPEGAASFGIGPMPEPAQRTPFTPYSTPTGLVMFDQNANLIPIPPDRIGEFLAR